MFSSAFKLEPKNLDPWIRASGKVAPVADCDKHCAGSRCARHLIALFIVLLIWAWSKVLIIDNCVVILRIYIRTRLILHIDAPLLVPNMRIVNVEDDDVSN